MDLILVVLWRAACFTMATAMSEADLDLAILETMGLMLPEPMSAETGPYPSGYATHSYSDVAVAGSNPYTDNGANIYGTQGQSNAYAQRMQTNAYAQAGQADAYNSPGGFDQTNNDLGLFNTVQGSATGSHSYVQSPGTSVYVNPLLPTAYTKHTQTSSIIQPSQRQQKDVYTYTGGTPGGQTVVKSGPIMAIPAITMSYGAGDTMVPLAQMLSLSPSGYEPTATLSQLASSMPASYGQSSSSVPMVYGQTHSTMPASYGQSTAYGQSSSFPSSSSSSSSSSAAPSSYVPMSSPAMLHSPVASFLPTPYSQTPSAFPASNGQTSYTFPASNTQTSSAFPASYGPAASPVMMSFSPSASFIPYSYGQTSPPAPNNQAQQRAQGQTQSAYSPVSSMPMSLRQTSSSVYQTASSMPVSYSQSQPGTMISYSQPAQPQPVMSYSQPAQPQPVMSYSQPAQIMSYGGQQSQVGMKQPEGGFAQAQITYSAQPQPSFRPQPAMRPMKKVYVQMKQRKKRQKLKIISIQKGFFIPGGTQLFGKYKTLRSCQKACAATPSCFAGDYNPWLKKCYIHSNFTACATVKAHKKLVHFKKVPCEFPEAPQGRVMLGVQLFKAIEQKAIKNLGDCLKRCSSAGSGIPSDVADIGDQVCFGIDYDFASHRCYFHVDNDSPEERICPMAGEVPVPRDAVPNPSVISILLCPAAAAAAAEDPDA